MKIPPNVKIGLGISSLVVIILIIVVLIVMHFLKKKIHKQYFSVDGKLELEKLKIKNPSYGIILTGLKKYYDTPLNDTLVAFSTNTICLNDYKTILLYDVNSYLANSISILLETSVNLVKLPNYIENQKFSEEDEKLINSKSSVIKQNQDEILTKTFDLILYLNKTTENLQQIISNSLSQMKEKSMLLVSFDKFNEVKEIKNFLIQNNLKYETQNFEGKNIIIIANAQQPTETNIPSKGE
ncbi:BC85_0335 family putative methyltransferase [Metamycoplasma hyosynoviae]|uniref:Uncharacterized protein n=1 Tax=Metamycoplasma hyosynoviae TaxID=29559 RepID=A0A9Q9BYW2_9BACT|nr:hypothetical protein [Metamycoplasma hyosynoviae]MDC8900283.1 hypothetical protein [Metamycoplasma hyosynoviae]MDC8911708.1 hypothetical protein [Metamycoplasma hyosynoviae]MDC8914436.1 hypothetical protein [Metamycoplasma hyosynoviae]MDC8918399.1 hypothetical protein [Metamycoplasma hyosynoviae]MDC8920760.1 hypothetical protein [Metamycoplasma hyosynoviae]